MPWCCGVPSPPGFCPGRRECSAERVLQQRRACLCGAFRKEERNFFLCLGAPCHSDTHAH